MSKLIWYNLEESPFGAIASLMNLITEVTRLVTSVVLTVSTSVVLYRVC